MMSFSGTALVLALAVSQAAVAVPPHADYGGNPASQYYVDESALPFDPLPGLNATQYWGEHKNAGYRIEVPENWNGELVLYAHGYRGETPRLYVSNPPIREYLLKEGYAWAASSYSTTGYDVATGVKDTHALAKFFYGKVGKPERTYIIGHSMGGHVTAQSIEQFPNAYAGALPMCGSLMGPGFYNYMLDYAMVAQTLAEYPAMYPSPSDYQTSVTPYVSSALGLPDSLTADGEQFKAAAGILSGGHTPLFDYAFERDGRVILDRALARTSEPTRYIASGNIMDNADTVYQLDDDPVLSEEERLLNELVVRVSADPQGVHPRGLGSIPIPTGDISVPVLTLHDMGIYVPINMEQAYARQVAAQGKSDLLVQRAIRDVDHCSFTTGEVETAFGDLVNWVEDGIKPEGDDFLSLEVVQGADFGTKFTEVLRPYDPLN